jgi:UDP-galactopyranose mutase
LEEDALIIYSGPIDKYFNYQYGTLGWRTIDFEVERKELDDYQGCSVMNYAEVSIPYTRIHEFKHYHPERDQSKEETIIFKEFSRKANQKDDPYYPINTDSDKEMYNKYLKETKNCKNTIFGGRLGLYKYLDMHQVISIALNTYKNEIKPIL